MHNDNNHYALPDSHMKLLLTLGPQLVPKRNNKYYLAHRRPLIS